MRTQAPGSECIFCQIVAGNAPASFVYRDDLVTIHLHLHVLPRFPRDGFRVVLPEGYGTPVPRAELDDAAEAIRRDLERDQR